MPRLFAARSIERTIRTKINIRWLVKALSVIVNLYPPALEELCIIYYTAKQVIQPPYLGPGIMPVVNAELMKMRALPLLRWRLDFEPEDDGHHAEYFAGFPRFIELALPTFHADGRLVVERYSSSGETGEWAVR
jgi:hypothetical protein